MEEPSVLVKTIIKGIQEKKGQDIVVADLRTINGSITNYFVICQGNSPMQVEAITESIGEQTRKFLGEKPVNIIGLGSDQWVAMDYIDVMVHIFLPEAREFYDLEDLWQDAVMTRMPNLD